MLRVILFCALGGVLGTGLGGIIGSVLGNRGRESIFKIMSFAAGVMLAVVCFELMPASVESSNIVNALMGVVWGVFITYLINLYISHVLKKYKVQGLKTQILSGEVTNVDDIKNDNNNLKTKKESGFNFSLYKTGLIIMLALSLHNIPEGLAIGTATSLQIGSGLTLAIVIALHDLPEGIAVSLPLVASGMSKFKAFMFALLSGVFTIVGGIIGHMLGTINDTVSAFCLAFAGGAMLFVVCFEIFPQISQAKNNQRVFIYSLIGVIVGFLIVHLV